MKFVENWDRTLKRAWSIRVAIFWSLVGAFVFVGALVSDKAQEAFGSWRYGVVLFIAAFSFGLARFLKQPGTDGVDQ